MKTVAVPASVARGDYQYHVLESGHEPGVLSGAELKGKAREYGGSYAESRSSLMERVFAYGVTDDLVLMPHTRRWTRVYVDVQSRERVRIEVVVDSR